MLLAADQQFASPYTALIHAMLLLSEVVNIAHSLLFTLPTLTTVLTTVFAQTVYCRTLMWYDC
jgi:hypothetical protein